jgi:hypothetical protein
MFYPRLELVTIRLRLRENEVSDHLFLFNEWLSDFFGSADAGNSMNPGGFMVARRHK